MLRHCCSIASGFQIHFDPALSPQKSWLMVVSEVVFCLKSETRVDGQSISQARDDIAREKLLLDLQSVEALVYSIVEGMSIPFHTKMHTKLFCSLIYVT